MTEPQEPKPGYGEDVPTAAYGQTPQQPTEQYPTQQYGDTAAYGQPTTYGQSQQYGDAQQYGQTQQYGQSQQYGQAAPQTQAAQTQYPAAPQYGPPKSNAGWAAATIIFFWPIAFAAFNHLHDIYPKWAMGDHQGAQYASDRVKRLGQISLWIFIGMWILFVIGYIILIAVLVSAADSSYTYN